LHTNSTLITTYDKNFISNHIWKENKIIQVRKHETPLIIHESNNQKHQISTQKYEINTLKHQINVAKH
jgi:hypothetical protein